MYFNTRSLLRHACDITSYIVFVAALTVYWLTADRHASFWDCPEYVTCASLLEIGHPPGNPVWMLAMRAATMFFPPHTHAFVINLCSGLFMALAALFLSRIIFLLAQKIVSSNSSPHSTHGCLLPACASLCGGLCFAFCDSAWFSAVEAEVYAMSAFLSSFSIWLMLRAVSAGNAGKRARIYILVAYITGLSLGVHQLNLLCIPVFALIYAFKRNPAPGAQWKAWGAILISFALIALMLTGIMSGILRIGEWFELTAVNTFNLPYFSGVIAFPIFLTVVFITALALADRHYDKPSGRRVYICTWMAGMLLLGYFSFAMILVRGYASPPMNEAAPTDVFALKSYIERDQYGTKPLFYGRTPFSKPLVKEEWKAGKSRPEYSRLILKKKHPRFVPLMPGARLHHRSGLLSADDSAKNIMTAQQGNGYLLADYSFSPVTTPELDMWLPRITGGSKYDLESYEDWAGMNIGNMVKVAASETIDSLGNLAGKILPDGTRAENVSYRPTYMQNLKMFATYQAAYMYFRYLLWNFMGRQNDYHSTGEIEHGNFITGFAPVDNAMLGDQSLMPDHASNGNKGRNVYFCIPFLLGLAGMIYLARSGREGRRIMAIISLFFLMTGLAIVVYLNQDPGEPRERDYSFLGSYMAFCMWIGFGAMAMAKAVAKLHMKQSATLSAALALSLLPGIIMAVENYDDHDRTGRGEPYDFASRILKMDRPAIIFSQGDNYTFPLWYAQEVMNIGHCHTVVDLSYLASPDYVVNLMKQGDRGLRLTARLEDIAYGAYSFTKLTNDADSAPIPLIDALKELYATTGGAPVMRHSKVTLPGRTMADTLVIDLRKLNPGSPMIPFRQLMILDILASNLEESAPRSVYFLNPVQYSFHKPLSDATRQSVYARVYAPFLMDSAFNSAIISDMRIAAPSNSIQKKSYADPVIKDMKRRQRGAIIIGAKELLDKGHSGEARNALVQAAMMYPYSLIEAGTFTLTDSTFYEGAEYLSTMFQVYKVTEDIEMLRRALKESEAIGSQAKSWEQYYKSLSAGQRAAVSNETRRIIWSKQRVDILSDSLRTAYKKHQE